MIKRISAFSLASGKDPEELWKAWYEHAVALKAAPHLKKYVLNRVREVLPNHDGSQPTVRHFGIVEMWFDNKASHDIADEEMHNIVKTLPQDDFSPLTSTPRFTYFVEETVIK